MEFVFYAIGVTIAVIGAIVYLVYTEVQSMDQNMWNQNNALKQKIAQLEGEVLSLNKTISEIKEEKSEKSEE
jgi:hypothetical protein